MGAVPITQIPDGMVHWLDQFPMPNAGYIEIWRVGDHEVRRVHRASIYSAVNVAGLYWRPAKAAVLEFRHPGAS